MRLRGAGASVKPRRLVRPQPNNAGGADPKRPYARHKGGYGSFEGIQDIRDENYTKRSFDLVW